MSQENALYLGLGALHWRSRSVGLLLGCFGLEATLWRFPIETVSQSESGFERIYQASSLLLHWALRLQPGQDWPVRLLVGFDKTEP